MTNDYPIAAIPLADLYEPPKPNHNHMSADSYAALVKAMVRFGCLQPLLARSRPEGGFWIVDGRHRWRAAGEAGLAQVPCLLAESDEDVAAIQALGLNRMRGEPDLSVVAVEIGALVGSGATDDDLALTGFSKDEIAALLTGTPPEADLVGFDLGAAAEPKSPKHTFKLAFKSAHDLNWVVSAALSCGPSVEEGLLAWAKTITVVVAGNNGKGKKKGKKQ